MDICKTNEEENNVTISPNASKFQFKMQRHEDNITIKFVWASKSRQINPFTPSVLQTLIDHFPENIFQKKINSFTEIIKNNRIYRADIDYRHNGCWHDNVLVAWSAKTANNDDNESIQEEEDTLVPAEIKMFFQFESESTLYSIIHSCHYRNEKMSVLSVIWMKEYYNVSISEFPSYKTNNAKT